MKISLLPLFIVSLVALGTSPSAALALGSANRTATAPSQKAPDAAGQDRQPNAFPEGVVVEEVRKGLAGDMAGLRPGDVLLAWSLPTSESSGAEPQEHLIRSPFDLTEISLEQVPRWPLRLRGLRDREPFGVVVPAEGNGLQVDARPVLPEPLLDLYGRGRTLVKGEEIQEGTGLWREVVATARSVKGGEATGCWLLGRIGSAWAKADIETSRGAYGEAIACAGTLGPAAPAAVIEDQARAEWRSGHLQEAVDAYTAALKARRETEAGALAQAPSLSALAILARTQGQTDRATGIDREAVSALESEAPKSLALAGALTLLGWGLVGKGDLDAAEDVFSRARGIAEPRPAGPTLAAVLSGQAILAQTRGDLAIAERMMRRGLEIHQDIAPRSLYSAIFEMDLGAIAAARGDVGAAEEWYRGALSIAEGAENAGRFPAVIRHNLGVAVRLKGDLVTAEDLLRNSLAEFEAGAPGSDFVAAGLKELAETVSRRGDRGAAKELLKRALGLSERLTPEGTRTADTLTGLGDVANAEGDWEAAEDCYGRARVIYERLAPASADLARALHGQGTVRRARGQLDEAASLFALAIEALEVQRGRLGGSDQARSLFTSHFFGVYQDQIELLADQGRGWEAFDVLERSRARSLLTLTAERDLVLEDEVSPQLERDRRRADAEYERTRDALAKLSAQKEPAEIERLTLGLRDLRDKQLVISDKIRETSPRLADLRDPQPLDAEGVRASLDPGTAFLAYSVGKDKTVLFVLTVAGAGARVPGGVRAITIPLGEAQLRERIERWRRLAERTVPPAEFFTEGRALYDLLMRPAEPHLRSARRLLVSPDGPLHQLPFAALRRGESYLAEWKPLSLVPSGTLYAQMARSRECGAYATDFEAFGDARAPDLDPLPATRQEVEAIARLFPRAAVHLGEEATEERAKAVGKDVRYVHFASHGLIDEHLPLDSALALSAPAAPGEGRDNGRLHAWEIIERVRLDADLVTLSACRSAVGTELAGEGLIGLTRAFQYAGARSVLASLWSVGDKSTFDLMNGVYRFLKSGLPKDEALRRAQVQAIRRGHHPVRWAAFQLYGDWRSSPTQGVSVRAQREAGTPPAAEPAVALRGGPLPRQPAHRRRK